MGLCARCLFVFVLSLAIYIGYMGHQLITDVPIPELDQDAWWGPGEKQSVNTTIEPFKIHTPDEILIDLKARLTGFLERPTTPPLEGIGFEYGFNSDYLRTIVKYWRDQYDWRRSEAYLNSYPQFKTLVNGLKLHYIHVKPKNIARKRVLPILLLHGWPGSVREFYEFFPILTKTRDNVDFVFEVIAPSLPGFGFSQGASKPGMGSAQVAVILNNLMSRLGHPKYYLQGGDWGSILAKNMAALFPKNVLGIHVNMCVSASPRAFLFAYLGEILPSFVTNKYEQDLLYPLSKTVQLAFEETAYFVLQATKPSTIGTALSDTPAGLLAYTLEKVSTSTNKLYRSLKDGGLTRKYPLETWLDNTMIYWITNSITTSFYLYAEQFSYKQLALRVDRVPVLPPSACARFADDVLCPPRKAFEQTFRNVVQYSDFEEGGHYPSLEGPTRFANDIYSAVTKMEAFAKTS